MINKKIVIGIICGFGITFSIYGVDGSMGPLGGNVISGLEQLENWFIGENLKDKDFFSYELCHIDYKNCQKFQMDFWINGTIQKENVDYWFAEVIVYDQNATKKGNMTLGMMNFEPVSFSDNIQQYMDPFKNSITWLSPIFQPND